METPETPEIKTAKIYKLINKHTEEVLCVGSTVHSLRKRFKEIQYAAQTNPPSNPKLKAYVEGLAKGWDDLEMKLIEEKDFTDRRDVAIRETELICQLTPLFNMRMPHHDMKSYHKEYYQKHKATVLSRCKAYYHSNKERISKMNNEKYAQERELILLARRIIAEEQLSEAENQRRLALKEQYEREAASKPETFRVEFL